VVREVSHIAFGSSVGGPYIVYVVSACSCKACVHWEKWSRISNSGTAVAACSLTCMLQAARP
jgi:hypothetical protein